MKHRIIPAIAVALACFGLLLIAAGIHGIMRPARPAFLDDGMIRRDTANDGPYRSPLTAP